MGRLQRLGPVIASQPVRVARASGLQSGDGREAGRREARPDRRLYNSAAWRRLRMTVLERDLFTCRRCGRVEADTSQLVADHIAPHLGDERMFFDPENLQCLCKACHDRDKQREERRGW